MPPPFTVLMVCMGNICRSPMAERLLVAAARSVAGSRVDELLYVHGAGTGGWHAGEPMDPGAARQVRARGGDPAGFRARKLRGEDVDASDLILTATIEQVDHVLGLRADAADRTFVLGEFGRLLAPPPRSGGSTADAVYARGVALVESAAKARAGAVPTPDDEVADPWGRSDTAFAQVADHVDSVVRPLAAALFAADLGLVSDD